MAQKEQQRQVYRTAKGREIDMTKLISQNELTLAVGNMSVNARGDKIGPGGKIIAKREQLHPASTPIPETINKPATPVAAPAPVVTETAPVAEVPVKPLTPAQKAKLIKDMDPEGNE
jgi:hypothetical protein